MNPFTEDEVTYSPNPFEDDNLSEVDLEADRVESHLHLTGVNALTDGFSGQSLNRNTLSDGVSGGQGDNEATDSGSVTRHGSRRISARNMDEVAAQLIDGKLIVCRSLNIESK